MAALKLSQFAKTRLTKQPFEYLVLRDFVKKPALKAAQNAYPEVPGPGSHAPGGLKIEGGFKQLIDELEGPEFRKAVEKKFGIDLAGRPTMYTVRGFCRARDGKMHTDSTTKIITVLLYMNDEQWPSDKGRLRLLRNGSDLEDYIEEIEPAGGTLLIFKRSDNSWHGHHSFEGQRRAIQLNWVTDQSVVEREQGRHGISSKLKQLFSFAGKRAETA